MNQILKQQEEEWQREKGYEVKQYTSVTVRFLTLQIFT